MIMYNKMPSEILRIKDEYTSFCFDEACMFLVDAIKNDKKLKFKENSNTSKENIKRTTFVDMALKKKEKDRK
ncbi:TPA: hypothetical protein SHW33_003350 [Clostridioides difficile]|uniref:hypothetical protein n=3 Tax=Clostridioides difficile TaxID=1496 RepID=UPI0003B294B9|nr:hypothetical protein [Clostridioides difficile]EGT3679840.1 hypothetical protein [Clostridioides difficile]EGT3864787.1 hypothetical protein [Clostridioides difficile]EGT4186205.1 hypothetical protein [Clostridioides difficile]EGT4546177.1 hypothetical protein [Clostridioides difficile]EGT4599929.1 hypothetical protein [Clostridioides difficile]